jgi:hypothetical protein
MLGSSLDGSRRARCLLDQLAPAVVCGDDPDAVAVGCRFGERLEAAFHAGPMRRVKVGGVSVLTCVRFLARGCEVASARRKLHN